MTPEPDPVFDRQLTTLQLSEVRRLERMHQSDWLPHGARLARSGVGMEAGGDLSGWIAYGNSETDLQLPSWPEWTVPVRLDDVLPATVEVVGLYHGGEWRRAVGAVNARLAEQSRNRGAIPADQVERAWLTLRQRHHAEQFRQAQWEYRNGRAAEGRVR
jgi:hypothetical protein